MSTLTVAKFLELYIPTEKHEEASESMQELFASMHHQMAKDFFVKYTPDEISLPAVVVAKKKTSRGNKKTEEKVVRKLCCGVTLKNEPCKMKALEGEDLCRVHKNKKDKPPAEKNQPAKAKKASKKKSKKEPKKNPAHTHALTEENVSDCDECKTAGNHAAPQVDYEFEEVDMQAKLKNLVNEMDSGGDPFELDLNKDLDLDKSSFEHCLDSDCSEMGDDEEEEEEETDEEDASEHSYDSRPRAKTCV